MHTHAAVNGRQGRILIAEDDPRVRKPISLMLKKEGYDIVEAEDGEQAIQKIGDADNALRVDTILCDIRMPKINGDEAIVYFRGHFPSVPIVVMTGYPDVEHAVSLMRKGIRDYLVKPVSKDELLTVMKKSVEQHVILS